MQQIERRPRDSKALRNEQTLLTKTRRSLLAYATEYRDVELKVADSVFDFRRRLPERLPKKQLIDSVADKDIGAYESLSEDKLLALLSTGQPEEKIKAGEKYYFYQHEAGNKKYHVIVTIPEEWGGIGNRLAVGSLLRAGFTQLCMTWYCQTLQKRKDYELTNKVFGNEDTRGASLIINPVDMLRVFYDDEWTPQLGQRYDRMLMTLFRMGFCEFETIREGRCKPRIIKTYGRFLTNIKFGTKGNKRHRILTIDQRFLLPDWLVVKSSASQILPRINRKEAKKRFAGWGMTYSLMTMEQAKIELSLTRDELASIQFYVWSWGPEGRRI